MTLHKKPQGARERFEAWWQMCDFHSSHPGVDMAVSLVVKRYARKAFDIGVKYGKQKEADDALHANDNNS